MNNKWARRLPIRTSSLALLTATALTFSTAGCLGTLFGPPGDPNDPDAAWVELQATPSPSSAWWNFTVLMHVNQSFEVESGGSQGAPWWLELSGGPSNRSVPIYHYWEEDQGADVITKLQFDKGTHTWSFPWNGHDEGEPGHVPHDGELVEPGAYQLSASRTELDAKWSATRAIRIP